MAQIKALQPGQRCACGCGCAIPKAKTVKGCPCACGGSCPTCGPAPRTQAETAPTASPGRTPVHETDRRPTVPATPQQMSDAQFARLLAQVRAARPATQASPTGPAIEATPLHELSQDALGRRLVARLSENHAATGPHAVSETAGTRTTARSALAEQAAALPAVMQSMSLSEALAARHDPDSQAWTRPANTGGLRTIFDA